MHKFLLFILLSLPLITASAADSFAPGFNDDFSKIQRERAATYRLERSKFKAPAGYNEEAQARLTEIDELLKLGEYKAARKLAKRSYLKDYPYSSHTADLLNALICAHLPEHLPEGKKHKLYTSEIYNRLNDLWLRFPDFPQMRETFTKVLEATEFIQKHGTVIDIHAETIEEVVTRSWGLHLNAALDLYHFLERNGDKHNIAPRASIGIARIYLLQGTADPRKLFMARAKYLQFLDRYPNNTLVFNALLERAYSHLLAYRGDKYDVGVLIKAAYILKQAELYSEEDEVRVALIQKLRDLIRSSHQARDYQVAIWYKEKGHHEASLYYFKEVVKRDPNSSKGLDAARILNDIEQAAKSAPLAGDEE